MSELPYSFHLGSNKNRKATSRNNAKNNLSNTTSLSNNGIQNYQQLSKVNNHDFRKYENNTKDIYTIKGTNDIVKDVKDFYKKEFEEARLEYNNKQSRPSRRIDDYFENVNKDEKRDLACEIILELGNKAYWDTKNDSFKRNMIYVYEEQLKDLEELVPEFKITNAVVHLDETSPHMHIVGVPIKENCKTGLSKQVNKSYVFTKERLEHIQSVMRKKCIESFNNIYNLNASLKTKEKGRNKDIHVKDMEDYQELKKELEVNKKSIEKNSEKIKNIKQSSQDLSEVLNNLESGRLGGYKLNGKQKARLKDLLKNVEDLSEYFDNFTNVINNLSTINDKLKNEREENKELKVRNLDLIREINGKNNDFNEVIEDNYYLRKELKDKKTEHIKLMTYLSEGVNSNDIKKSKTFTRITNDLKDRKVINKNEHRLIFKPPKLISEAAFEQAIRHINQQNEEAAEEFYKMNSNSKKDDYQI